jgi:hypothetical protein
MPKSDLEDRQVKLLEILAATAIFSIVGIVLYMIFQYKPS